MNNLLMVSVALVSAQSGRSFEYMDVHGRESVIHDHTAIVVQWRFTVSCGNRRRPG